jgi:hypothetical protein
MASTSSGDGVSLSQPAWNRGRDLLLVVSLATNVVFLGVSASGSGIPTRSFVPSPAGPPAWPGAVTAGVGERSHPAIGYEVSLAAPTAPGHPAIACAARLNGSSYSASVRWTSSRPERGTDQRAFLLLTEDALHRRTPARSGIFQAATPVVADVHAAMVQAAGRTVARRSLETGAAPSTTQPPLPVRASGTLTPIAEPCPRETHEPVSAPPRLSPDRLREIRHTIPSIR